jgi:hypothetical protein
MTPIIESPAPRANAGSRANINSEPRQVSASQAVCEASSIGPREFIAENAGQAAYWSDLAREAATIRDDALLTYATRKAAAFARAFVGAVKDMTEHERERDQ